MVEAGYTHSFCTPHIWPNLPENTVEQIVLRTARLQEAFDQAGIPLRLIPGGELNLQPGIVHTPPEQLPTYGMTRRYCLFDIWVDRLPPFFYAVVEWLQSLGLKVILAHPERMRAVQDHPELIDDFTRAGLLLQGNLQCLSDPPHAHTRRIAERLLKDGHYFLLGSDLHNLAGLPARLKGLQEAIRVVGQEQVWNLTRENPALLVKGTFSRPG